MGPQTPKPAGRAPGFLEWLRSLFESDDPERQKQRRLREIAAELKRSRPRFYNPVARTAEPALARFFYEIYRAIAAAQVLIKGAETSTALKISLVDLSLSQEELELKKRLTQSSIDERMKTGADPAAIAEEVRKELKGFLDGFEANWMNEVDALYNRVLVLLDLVSFDFWFLLRRFDPSLPERDFSYKPKFASIDAALVREELQDFLEILPGVDPDADWDRVAAILKEHRGIEVVPRDALRKSLSLIREVQRTGAFHMIVRHMVENPAWKPMVRTHRERIVEPYIARLKMEAETTAQKAAHGKKNEKIAELARQVFGAASVSRLENYSEKANTVFAQKMLGGFLHVTALNYLRAFLDDYLPKSIREVVDLLLIKGSWVSKEVSQQMSEAFHQLLRVTKGIAEFDGRLAEDGELGVRLRTIAIRAERDRKALVQLRMTLQQINDEARATIGDALQYIMAIARVLKLAHEDCVKPKPELLVNWRDLKGGTDRDIRGLIAAVYRKIYGFVQLMQFYR